MQLPPEYNIKEAEARWQKYWEKEKIYKFDEKSKKPIFSIDTPPPTVSGKMHLGHSFSYSHEDFIARYKRMRGYNVFYPFGTDDNGLATERLIEKLNNVKSTKMDRKEFVELCLKTLNKIRPDFVNDWKKLAMSCDFSIFYTTINEHSQRISQRSFIDLYKQGREYRKKAPTIWCPTCETAIAQVDLRDKELDSYFNDIKFKLENGQDIIISTTRPELIPACVALFFNPEDNRYKKLLGKKVKVPLFNYEVEIKSDKRVEKDKGTGIVMCCTFGDQVDAEWYKAYKLPLRELITKDGRLSGLAGKYSGMKINDARKEILEDLKKNNLLVKQEKIKHVVNVHERCDTEIEFLESEQWFIKYLDLREQFLKNSSELNWYPGYMKNRLDNWIKGLQWDWCISRQRHFGIPFPVWYCKKCNEVILADEKQLPVDPLKDKPLIKECPKCKSNEFIPEKDVLDTWPTSSLTPIIARELFKGKKIYDKLFPMDLRPQAADIITFWLFNTLVKSQLHYKKNPWKDVMISGYVLLKKEKMSKSKGNIIKPQEVIEDYGADSLRFWAASVKLGEDLEFQDKDINTAKRTITKLFNASKLILMNLKDYKNEKPKKLELIDLWLLSKLNNIVKNSIESFDKYEYSKTKLETENFFWNVFCDYYLEIVKDRLYNPNIRGKDAKISAQYTLNYSLLTILKLFAPIMPHITEEIYHYYYTKKENKKSIHLSDFPEYKKELLNKKAEKVGDELISLVSQVRQFKSKNNKSLKEPVDITLPKSKHQELRHVLADFKAVTNAKNIIFGNKFDIKF